MKEKDKQILKDSIDTILSSIPALNIAWGLSKALYDAGLKLRQQKALEWVEMIRDNPAIFTQDLLLQEEFQDGFVFALEKYIIERNEERRNIFRNIFLGYSSSTDRPSFSLERFIHTLSQIDIEDIKVLKDVDLSRDDKNYQIYGDTSKYINNIFNLINLGILHNDFSSRIGPIEGPFVWISEFGKEFIKYIKEKN